MDQAYSGSTTNENWQLNGIKRLWDAEEDEKNFSNHHLEASPPQAKRLCVDEGVSFTPDMSITIPNSEQTNFMVYSPLAPYPTHSAQSYQLASVNSTETYQELQGHLFARDQGFNHFPQDGTVNHSLPGIQSLPWFSPPALRPECQETLAPLPTSYENLMSELSGDVHSCNRTMTCFSHEANTGKESYYFQQTEFGNSSTDLMQTVAHDSRHAWPSNCLAGTSQNSNNISQLSSACSEMGQPVPATFAFEARMPREPTDQSYLPGNIPNQPRACSGSHEGSHDATPPALTISSTCQTDTSANTPLGDSEGLREIHESVECGPDDTSLEEPLSVDYDTCFGMISSGTVKLSKEMPHNSEDKIIDVELKIRGNWATVHYKDSMEYAGLLDHDTALALARLTQTQSVTLIATLPIQKMNRYTKSKSESTTNRRLQIVVYGFSQDGRSVGTLLSDAGIYLQRPQFYDTCVVYKNPHYLARPGCEIQVSDSNEPVQSTIIPKKDQWRDGATKNQVLKVFDAAQGPLHFSEIEASKRLCTTLKSHQRKALAMMVEKESGKVEGNEFGSVWELRKMKNGQKRYYNLITGLSAIERPTMSLGGLLADEMGLGKTLTALALVAGSIDQSSDASAVGDVLKTNTSQHTTIRTTLIVTPLSTLSTWDEQIKRHIHPGGIRVCLYHGPNRSEIHPDLQNHDIVITTYATLATEWSRNLKSSAGRFESLHSYHWRRVVLDEAHCIRDRSSLNHRSVYALHARFRWCLTGTPIQNRIEDFGALINFLRVQPFDSQSMFTHHIANPVKNGDQSGFKKLKKLVHSTSMRRTKASIFGTLDFPSRINQEKIIELDGEERSIYAALKDSCIEVMDFMSCSEDRQKPVGNVFKLILRLRQVCNHTSLLPANVLNQVYSKDFVDAASNGQEICNSCGSEVVITESKNTYEDSLAGAGALCADCKYQDKEGSATDTSPGTAFSNELGENDIMDVSINHGSSSKIEALLQNLHAYRTHSTAYPIKSVVFTCWTKMLDLIGTSLASNGFVFQRIDGAKSDRQRRAALEAFRTNPGCTILLASIGSAGVGLDLTAACRVHLMEPQWNPMAEEQALDRVHRMGQTREVIATRYIVRDSIEEYVTSIQKKKLELIQDSLHGESTKGHDVVGQYLKNWKAAL